MASAAADPVLVPLAAAGTSSGHGIMKLELVLTAKVEISPSSYKNNTFQIQNLDTIDERDKERGQERKRDGKREREKERENKDIHGKLGVKKENKMEMEFKIR